MVQHQHKSLAQYLQCLARISQNCIIPPTHKMLDKQTHTHTITHADLKSAFFPFPSTTKTSVSILAQHRRQSKRNAQMKIHPLHPRKQIRTSTSSSSLLRRPIQVYTYSAMLIIIYLSSAPHKQPLRSDRARTWYKIEISTVSLYSPLVSLKP